MKRIVQQLLGIFFLIPLFTFAQPAAEANLADQYYQDGEYESALELYEKLVKNDPTEQYVTRLVSCYEQLDRAEDALKLLDRTIKREPKRVIYPVIKALLLEKTGDLRQSEKLFDAIIQKQLETEGHFIQVGAYLYQAGKLELALQSYLEGRKRLNSDYIFAGEIANIYKQLNAYGEATEDYLNLYYQNSSNLSNASLEILNLVRPESRDAIEQVLLRAAERKQSSLGLRAILYEFYVLTENFYEAFVQVKSIDRLFKEDGERVFAFAETMRNNRNYDLSNRALDYIIERKEDSRYYYQAHMGKAINGELQAFSKVPIDMLAVRQAVADYETLLSEFGRSPRYFEAIYRQAKLMVFYLYDLDQALRNLNQIVAQLPRNDDWAQAQLLIGDILLMQQEYIKAKAAYTEVSDQFSDGNPQLRALAKYKLAQLSYYKGEFNLAQALLGAIKDNTSNDISNDAIRLNLLIIDNTGLDTTTTALEVFARAQLLSFQRKYDESLTLLDSLAYEFPTHSLADEILWEKASIFLIQNNIPLALEFIDRILETFPYDIYGDDALYTKARIYDYSLNDPESAMKYYLELLTSFPGSLFSVEARKRIRELRNEG
jgi:tetratricopeptide (TPR) repeat protein